MKKLHEDLAHPGSKRLYHTVNKYVYAKNLKRIIEKITSECLKCQKNKENPIKFRKHTGFIFSSKPFEMISSDILGPVKTKHFKTKTNHEYFYLITITDIYSRFTKVFLSFDIKANSLIRCFSNYFKKFTIPKKILTDRGRQYISNDFNNFIKKYDIKHLLTSPYNPTANGISERINSTIKNILGIYKGHQLRQITKKIEININYCFHSILKASPFEILNGYSIFDFKKRDLFDKLKHSKENEKRFKEKEMIKKNKKRKDVVFNEGDIVLRRNIVQDKILDRYLGPYKVIKTDDATGNVWVDENNRIVRHNKKNLKPFKEGGECRASKDSEILKNQSIDQNETNEKSSS
ncbi:hypothetical protein DMUE_1134, partial [Dictyocoela muelleri]